VEGLEHGGGRAEAVLDGAVLVANLDGDDATAMTK